ncbi:hypothetical protein FE257_005739 [Aspergillus nanangensis]|uniref:RdRP-like PH domain-containing protein n=1 Tax=Aspergillus nanangensis TaxID=2582783 RepID=A0AAD4GWK6_ASPNN|nr:hypothetical protein FE257_005739 [Aspergillus nanangensis]
MGTGAFCKRSTREPDVLTLRALKYRVERKEQLRIKSSSDPSTPEVTWSDMGEIKVKARNFIVSFGKPGTKQILRIPLTTIVGLIYSSDSSITLVLSDVPFIFECKPTTMDGALSLLGLGETVTDNETVYCRIPALSPEHSRVVGQCLVYQFLVSPTDFEMHMKRLKEHEISVFQHDFPNDALKEAWWDQFGTHHQLHALQGLLAGYTQKGDVPFGVLFQL